MRRSIMRLTTNPGIAGGLLDGHLFLIYMSVWFKLAAGLEKRLSLPLGEQITYDLDYFWLPDDDPGAEKTPQYMPLINVRVSVGTTICPWTISIQPETIVLFKGKEGSSYFDSGDAGVEEVISELLKHLA